VVFADREVFLELVEKISHSVKQLLNSFKLGNVIKNGVSVAIVGKPNAGKSTLLNTLLNENRAIVSEIPGTTRDTIEEIINIEGILFRLIDTAGIREHTHDVIESMGVMRSLQKIKEADIVLYIFDVSNISEQELDNIMTDLLSQEKKYLLAGNKMDTLENGTSQEFLDKYKILFISAKENEGIDKLKLDLFTTITGSDALPENIVITNARHYEALQQVDISLGDIRCGITNNIPADLLTLDIRRCLHYLGEITGEITNEDRLDYIFSKFCIGK
jgi:tRNA modification GTPase